MSKRQGHVVSRPTRLPPSVRDFSRYERCDGCDELDLELRWYPGTALRVCRSCFYRWRQEDARDGGSRGDASWTWRD